MRLFSDSLATLPTVVDDQDQANEKDYSHEGFGFAFKKLQADVVSKLMTQREVKLFKADETATKVSVAPTEDDWSGLYSMLIRAGKASTVWERDG